MCLDRWQTDEMKDQPAVIWEGEEGESLSVSYKILFREVRYCAEELRSYGFGKGDPIAIHLPMMYDTVIALLAIGRIGAIAVPVFSGYGVDAIANRLNAIGAKALFTCDGYPRRGKAFDAFTIAEEAIKSCSTIQKVWVTKRTGDLSIWKRHPDSDFFLEFDEICGSDGKTSDPEPTLAEDPLIILYTSGTTGKPKGCLLTHGNIIANARQICEWLGFTERDRLLTVMPLFHMNAVSVTTMSALYAGGSTVVSPRFSASRFWQIISQYEITSFGSVATMLSILLNNYAEGVPVGLKTEQLRFAMCGSAPVPAETLRRFEETFNCLVIEGYGLSESTCRSTFNPPDQRRRAGSCGMPIGNEMKVVDEDDREVADGELGEIVLRGENILRGYYKNPEATAIAFRGGWFHTGDIGYRDEAGFYYIVDRKSDMIIRGGENIYPREIDEVLYRHPAIAAAATIGVPDPLYGEEVAAFIVPKDGVNPTAEEIIEYCRAHLADYKCPKTVRIVSDIPKGPTGKLLKRELARQFSQPT